MKKILFVLMFLLPCVCVAEDNVSVGVADRVNCADIQKQIDNLNALENLTDEENAELTLLKNTQRIKCTQKASGARVGTVRTPGVVSKNAPVPVENITKQENMDCESLKKEIERLQTQYDKMCAVDIEPEKLQQLRANGLCPDESKPNKFGCCDGETFKEVGDMDYKCCPNDGGECLPLVVPIKQ